MIDTNYLKEKINKSNYTIEYIAKELKLTEKDLLNKIENKKELYASEISYIIDLLKLSIEDQDKIFFNSFVEKYSTLNEA